MRGPSGLLKRVLLIEVAGTEVLELPGVATQPEASGQVGEVPVAVSWVWHPGAPRGGGTCEKVGVPAQGRLMLRGPSM